MQTRVACPGVKHALQTRVACPGVKHASSSWSPLISLGAWVLRAVRPVWGPDLFSEGVLLCFLRVRFCFSSWIWTGLLVCSPRGTRLASRMPKSTQQLKFPPARFSDQVVGLVSTWRASWREPVDLRTSRFLMVGPWWPLDVRQFFLSRCVKFCPSR